MRRPLLVLSLTLVAAAACGSHGSGSGKPVVAVSIFPLYDIARRVAGPDLDVRCVLPPGKSEHSYDPTPREVASIADAKLAIGVGFEMDAWLTRIVRGAAGDDVRVEEIGPRLSPRSTVLATGDDAADEARDQMAARGEQVEAEHHHGPTDPHVWLDPQRMQRAATIFEHSFSSLDPRHSQNFHRRAVQVIAQLDQLDQAIQGRAQRWSRHTIVTFHGSMGYYAARYGLTIAAVVEPFPGREPTARYMAEVLAAIGTSHPAALFSEPQLDPRPARVIAQQSGVPLFELDPIGGTPETNTYEKLLTRNTDVLEQALR